MIKGILIVNNYGQVRLQRFYQEVPDGGSAELVRRIFQQVGKRPDNFCNYLELATSDWGPFKIIYRHYATLYFIFAVDQQESELGILDLIQVFVEALDKCFENVCELDIIFHSDKVNYCLDDIVMGGMVLETNIVSLLQAVNDQNKLYKKSLASTLPTTKKETPTSHVAVGVGAMH